MGIQIAQRPWGGKMHRNVRIVCDGKLNSLFFTVQSPPPPAAASILSSLPAAIRHWGNRAHITSSLNHPLWRLSCHLSSATTSFISISQPFWLVAGLGNWERERERVILYNLYDSRWWRGWCYWGYVREIGADSDHKIFFSAAMQKKNKKKCKCDT